VSSDQDPSPARQVYRTTGSTVAWWAWLVFAVAVLAVLALRYHDHPAAVTAALIIAITGIMYACALRPRIVADAAGLTVHNPLRTHVLPWPVVTKVDLAQTLQVHHCGPSGSARERIVHSWAIQSSGRAMTRSAVRARRAARRAQPEPGYARLPEEARLALQGSAAEFITRQLDERVRAEHQRAGPGEPDTGPVAAAQVHWAWWPLAGMVLPLLLLLIVVLA
jgi:Bacterial PH domain